MRPSLFSIVLLLQIGGGLCAQGIVDSLAPEFKHYLQSNGLTERWLSERERFACPRQMRRDEAEWLSEYPVKAADTLALRPYLQSGRVLPYTDLSAEALFWALRERGRLYTKQWERERRFFEAQKLNVLGIFARLPDSLRCKTPFLTVDITASMAPYAEQVLLLTTTMLLENRRAHFLFFNDGDQLPEEQKTIGAAGGLYSAQGGIEALNEILAQMQLGMRSGTGGATPENDLEALLALQDQMDEADYAGELFLVADAHSPVRDLALVGQLRRPVRVLLCGLNEIYGKRHKDSKDKEFLVLADYLLIAYLTGGSLHALHEDVWDPTPYAEGKVVYVDAKPYLLENRTMRRLSKDEADQRLRYKGRQ